MKKCNDIRTEMKIGLLLIALFGVCNVVISAPEILTGLCFGAGIALIAVGGLGEGVYQRLKGFKKRA